jgi:hypothetical protein
MWDKADILALLQLLTMIMLAMIHALWYLLFHQVNLRLYKARHEVLRTKPPSHEHQVSRISTASRQTISLTRRKESRTTSRTRVSGVTRYNASRPQLKRSFMKRVSRI